jgi:hypothetical protein
LFKNPTSEIRGSCAFILAGRPHLITTAEV